MANILRNFRVDPLLWETAKTKAADDDRSLTSVLTDALSAYTGTATETFQVTGDDDLPVAARDHEWDGQGALERVFEAATDGDTVDTDFVARAFLWRDEDADPELKGSWSLGFADIVDGTLTIIPAGIAAAAARLEQTDVPENALPALKDALCDVYDTVRETYDDWPECPYAEIDEEAELIPLTAATKGPTAAIIGHGTLLTESENATIAGAVQQARELLATGAVAVSIGADMDPDSMPDKDELDALLAAGEFEKIEGLLADVPFRIRHVAIEDTAAFADARMALGEGGTVDGPVTFEGIWTGDMRYFAVGTLVWEDVLPVTLKLGHDGPVVGSIHAMERVEGEVTAGRPPSVQEEAIAASAGGRNSYPARYFLPQRLAGRTPLTITAPDSSGLRHVYGHIAPHGVCHRSDMAPCFTYPGDVDLAHKGFHTGAVISLDDGTSVRVGALTLGGSHINPALARQGVSAREVNAHRDDANRVFAMVRAFDDAHGLAVSGVVMPDVTEAELMRAQACAPSVELWPEGRGRTLVGAHLVPTPAWPVAASLGSMIEIADSENSVEVETAGVTVPVVATVTLDSKNVDTILASLSRIETALGALALEALTEVPLP